MASGGFVAVRVRAPDPVAGSLAGERPAVTIRWPHGASVELALAPSVRAVAELILALLGPCSR
jgi:hypothetical protein